MKVNREIINAPPHPNLFLIYVEVHSKFAPPPQLFRKMIKMLFFSSGILWEQRKGRRFKAVPTKDNILIEEAYTKFVNAKAVGENPASRVTVGTMEIVKII